MSESQPHECSVCGPLSINEKLKGLPMQTLAGFLFEMSTVLVRGMKRLANTPGNVCTNLCWKHGSAKATPLGTYAQSACGGEQTSRTGYA
jgi:hypothetical protein